MKLFLPRFNLPQETKDSGWRPNPTPHNTPCDCLTPQYENIEPDEDEEAKRPKSVGWNELSLHTEVQDTNSEAWKSLEAYVAKVRAVGAAEFDPIAEIGWERWYQISTLPGTIRTLQSVRIVKLPLSRLVRIPPEIGEMTNLEEFDPYTSRCLHWFPYEITRCKKLKCSRVSTRALYGNYKYRPPFPKLPQISPSLIPVACSVCGRAFSPDGPRQAWISVRVATDVLPLLVHACSSSCIENLPKPADGYVQRPHQGGLDLEQPPSSF